MAEPGKPYTEFRVEKDPLDRADHRLIYITFTWSERKGEMHKTLWGDEPLNGANAIGNYIEAMSDAEKFVGDLQVYKPIVFAPDAEFSEREKQSLQNIIDEHNAKLPESFRQ